MKVSQSFHNLIVILIIYLFSEPYVLRELREDKGENDLMIITNNLNSKELLSEIV